MVISSLVVDADPNHIQQIASKIGSIPGVEVHEIIDFKIVVTIEAETLDDSHRIATSFNEISGVISVGLVFCNFEDDPSL